MLSLFDTFFLLEIQDSSFFWSRKLIVTLLGVVLQQNCGSLRVSVDLVEIVKHLLRGHLLVQSFFISRKDAFKNDFILGM